MGHSAAVGGVVFANAPAPALTRLMGLFLLVTVLYRHTGWETTSDRFRPIEVVRAPLHPEI